MPPPELFINGDGDVFYQYLEQRTRVITTNLSGNLERESHLPGYIREAAKALGEEPKAIIKRLNQGEVIHW